MKKDKTKVAVAQETSEKPASAATHSPFSALRQEIDRLFDDFAWPEFGFRGRARGQSQDQPLWGSAFGGPATAMDLIERDAAYEIQLELPGLRREEIDLKITNEAVTITAEKSEEHEEKDETYHLSERSFGRIYRTFRLPPGIAAERAEARLESGVLKIHLPKSADAKKNERRIEIEAA